jgi:hypothetical protein
MKQSLQAMHVHCKIYARACAAGLMRHHEEELCVTTFDIEERYACKWVANGRRLQWHETGQAGGLGGSGLMGGSALSLPGKRCAV